MADTSTSRAPGRLTLSPAPHLRAPTSTARMNWLVSLSLVPAGVWGVFLFGLPAVRVIATSICVAVIAELASSALFRKFTLADGSALLTGLLVGLLIPPERRCMCRQRPQRSESSWSSRASAGSGGTG